MATEDTIDTVLMALHELDTDYSLEDTAELCPDLTWNQVFLAIADLSRSGHIRMTREVGGSDRVHVAGSPALRAPR